MYEKSAVIEVLSFMTDCWKKRFMSEAVQGNFKGLTFQSKGENDIY